MRERVLAGSSGISPSLVDRPDEACDAARLARALAPRLCGDASAGASCRAYHAIYPVLRLLGLAASPERHDTFYLGALLAAAQLRETRRLLVCGSADSGMLELVVDAWGRAGRPLPEIHVLDVCETPLRLCRAYAERRGFPITEHVVDALAFEPDRPFDLICTHSFMVKFTGTALDALVASWARWLSSEGRVVTTARIDADTSRAATGATLAQADAVRARFEQAVVPWLDRLGAPLDALLSDLEAHARDVESTPLASDAALERLFAQHGLEMERLDFAIRGRRDDGSGGAGTSRSARYAEFSARKRA